MNRTTRSKSFLSYDHYASCLSSFISLSHRLRDSDACCEHLIHPNSWIVRFMPGPQNGMYAMFLSVRYSRYENPRNLYSTYISCSVLWDIAPYNPLKVSPRSRGTCRLHNILVGTSDPTYRNCSVGLPLNFVILHWSSWRSFWHDVWKAKWRSQRVVSYYRMAI